MPSLLTAMEGCSGFPVPNIGNPRLRVRYLGNYVSGREPPASWPALCAFIPFLIKMPAWNFRYSRNGSDLSSR